ncbi:MAG: efflux RND transporter periplasmic adaptor subunit [Gallionella sp.]
MSGKKVGLFVSGLLIIAIFIWVVTTQGPLARVKVTTEKIQTGSFSNAVFGIGTLEARYSYNLAPTMTGRLKKVFVDQGDKVVAGQVLAEMDTVDLEEKLIGSRHMVEKSDNAIQVAEAQLVEANGRKKLSAAILVRYEELRKGGFVSQEMYELKQYESNSAIAAVEVANAALAAARQDSARARADVGGMVKLREQTRLVSPVNGVVVARLFEPGATVASGQTVLQVTNPESMWVKARIDQKQAGRVDIGQSAELILRSQPNSPLAGVVERVEMISDPVTEERIVDVAFQTAHSVGSIGETVEVTIKLPTMDKVHSVPSASVKRIDQRDGVWILKDGQVQFKPVRTGIATLDGRTQILDGLGDDDQIVVYSQQPLQAGLKVKVVPELVRSSQ